MFKLFFQSAPVFSVLCRAGPDFGAPLPFDPSFTDALQPAIFALRRFPAPEPPCALLISIPTTDIGASAWCVEMDGNRLLMDAGAHPKREGRASMPLYSAIANLKNVDAIAISHCHHDHVGSLPVAMRHFPKASRPDDRVELLPDGPRAPQFRQRHDPPARRRASGLSPLHPREVEDMEPQVSRASNTTAKSNGTSHEKTRAGFPSPTLEFHDAGHALGSAGILVRGKSQTLFLHRRRLFSRSNHPARPPAFPTSAPTSSSWKPPAATAPRRPASPAKPKSNGWPRPWSDVLATGGCSLDPHLRPGPHPGNPGPTGPDDGSRAINSAASPSTSADWAAFSPKFTI
jgi:glyoxylase-like metal-dependent hydrolase (beta-lactamase superfamily II)